jgi:hypothetical protein
MHTTATNPTSALPVSVVTTNSVVQNQATLSRPSPGTDPGSSAQTTEGNRNAPSNSTTATRTETLEIADHLSNVSVEGLRDEPDFDFYVEASWFVWIVIYTLCSICAVSICVVAYTALGTEMAVWVFYPDPRLWWTWSLLSIPLTFWCFILLVISVEDLKLQNRELRARDWVTTSMYGVLSLYFLFQLVVFGMGLPITVPPGGPLGVSNPMSWLYVVLPVELYLILAGYRAWTVLNFFLVVCLVAAVFTGPMLWAVYVHPFGDY